MMRLSELLQEMIHSFALELKAQKICLPEESFREARLLIGEALDLTPLELIQHLNTPVSTFPKATQERLKTFQKRRLNGEPLSRIRGTRAFWKDTFSLSNATLDPRPETEGLIELALRFFEKRPPPQKIIDLGTGTGCLLLSLLKEFPKAQGTGIDLSQEALETAYKNAVFLKEDNRCVWKKSRWLERVQGKFELVVSNPPYIASGDLKTLAPEVRLFDPTLALDGGQDGLDAYRDLIPQVNRHLAPEGVFLLEIGRGQEKDLEKILSPFFKKVTFSKDLGKIIRYIQAEQPTSNF
jgi:release factor glutamine methyltransferase